MFVGCDDGWLAAACGIFGILISVLRCRSAELPMSLIPSLPLDCGVVAGRHDLISRI